MAPALPHARGVLEAAVSAVPRLGVRDGHPRGGRAVDGVRALGHLLVHVLHRVAGDVDAGLAVGADQVGPDARGDARLGVEHLVEVVRREVRHPEGVVVFVGEGRRVRDLVVERTVLDVAGDASAALRRPSRGTMLPVKSSVAELLNSTRIVRSRASCMFLAFLIWRGLVLAFMALASILASIFASRGLPPANLRSTALALSTAALRRPFLPLISLPLVELFGLRRGVVDVVAEVFGRGRFVRACDSLGDEERRSEERQDDERRKQPHRGRTRRG